mmetsp:Transcript_52780/g.78239  ORF Transcript_52780/g.78239 Transcript_52780/m.78239 type:complete len:116 (-) Transcript_52780:278-625(-)
MMEKPPTYADIVGSGRCLHEHEEENVPLTRHQLPKLKPSKAAKHIHESRDYDLASDDDMWFFSKQDRATKISRRNKRKDDFVRQKRLALKQESLERNSENPVAAPEHSHTRVIME